MKPRRIRPPRTRRKKLGPELRKSCNETEQNLLKILRVVDRVTTANVTRSRGRRQLRSRGHWSSRGFVLTIRWPCSLPSLRPSFSPCTPHDTSQQPSLHAHHRLPGTVRITASHCGLCPVERVHQHRLHPTSPRLSRSQTPWSDEHDPRRSSQVEPKRIATRQTNPFLPHTSKSHPPPSSSIHPEHCTCRIAWPFDMLSPLPLPL